MFVSAFLHESEQSLAHLTQSDLTVSGAAESVTVSPDGNWLATYVDDQMDVRVYQLVAGVWTLEQTITDYSSSASTKIAMSDDGDYMVASNSGVMDLWEKGAGPSWTLVDTYTSVGDNQCGGVDITPDATRCVFYSSATGAPSESHIKILTISAGSLVGEDDITTTINVGPSGQQAISITNDGDRITYISSGGSNQVAVRSGSSWSTEDTVARGGAGSQVASINNTGDWLAAGGKIYSRSGSVWSEEYELTTQANYALYGVRWLADGNFFWLEWKSTHTRQGVLHHYDTLFQYTIQSFQDLEYEGGIGASHTGTAVAVLSPGGCMVENFEEREV